MPNYVTFKIHETRGGEFVVYLENHEKNLISEQYRSRDIDIVIERLKKEMNYRKPWVP